MRVPMLVLVALSLLVGTAADQEIGGRLQQAVTLPAISAPVTAPRDAPVASIPVEAPDDRPVSVAVPAIGVRSSLTDLQLTGNGELEVPLDPQQAGWWASGAIPGQPGPAVIAGHVDSYRGPGVFFRLRELKPGDTVQVGLSSGGHATFQVVSVDRYAKDHFPTRDVYGPTPAPELRLVTCGGSFDRAARSYRDNIVVYAVAAG
jgi:sortase (surface protein transpeptidase)